MRIIEAIVAGERDPKKLIALVDRRVRATPDKITQALRGDYRPEHLFRLQTALELYQTFESKILRCEEQIQQQLAKLPNKTLASAPAASPTNPPRPSRPASRK